jgi:hypothetical protein
MLAERLRRGTNILFPSFGVLLRLNTCAVAL